MGVESSEGKAFKQYHAVLVPFPAQGHVTPFMQLAKKLVRLGFHITFVNTTHNHHRIMKSKAVAAIPISDISFVAISDGLSDDHPRLADIPSFGQAIPAMAPALEDLLGRIILETPAITCVICDVCMSIAYEKAQKLSIGPVVAFATGSALSLNCTYHASAFIAAGTIPLPPPTNPSFSSVNQKNLCLRLPQSVSEISARKALLPPTFSGAPPGMRVKDLPTNLLQHDIYSIFIQFFTDHQNLLIPSHDCLLINTIYELEADAIDAMVGRLNSNIYTIGPLVLSSSSSFSEHDDGDAEPCLAGIASGLWEEDQEALLWLDSREPKSVLYVSFGSIAQASVSQVLELAWGLEQSQHAFLWVIRPDLVEDLPSSNEFIRFSKRTSNRALMISWAPQVAVLTHPSVRAFLTHCGWNSVIESISSGVPMLGWPFLADQLTNCFYLAHVWKIGLELEFNEANEFGEEKLPLVTKQEVEKKVKKIMIEDGKDPEMDNMRKNCRQVQSLTKGVVKAGGSSHEAFLQFLKQVGCSSERNIV